MRELRKALHPKVVEQLGAAQDEEGPTLVDTKKEGPGWTPTEVKPHEKKLKEFLDRPDNTGTLGTENGVQTKAVVNIGKDRYLLKPYHVATIAERDIPLSGWSEMTNQALYHAAGLGHLHQKAHVINTKAGPMVAIHMEPGVSHDDDDVQRNVPSSPQNVAARAQIGVMDFLTHNADRHGQNIMTRTNGEDQWGSPIADPNGLPLAIDHGRSFTYEHGNNYSGQKVSSPYLSVKNLDGGTSVPDLSWWRENGPKVRAAFEARLKLIKHKGLRDHLRENFKIRADRLDYLADPKTDHSNNEAWEMKSPTVLNHQIPKPKKFPDPYLNT